MPLRAVRLGPLEVTGPERVLAAGDWLHVSGEAAPAVGAVGSTVTRPSLYCPGVAEVVEFHPVGDWTVDVLPQDAVDGPLGSSWSDTVLAVSAGHEWPCPLPASVVTNPHLPGEASVLGLVEPGRHGGKYANPWQQS